MTGHTERLPEVPPAAFDFRKSELPGELPSDVLSRNIRDVREARGFTQRQLAERMTAAGTPMTHPTVSQIERGKRRVSVDELFVFAVVLEKSIVRLVTPRPDEETQVRVTDWRLYRSVEIRNWIVFGNSWTPAARGAQTMMQVAFALRDRLRGDNEVKTSARDRLPELLDEMKGLE
jgi:transcriptional regulator with XRE-family HTH domain